MSAGAQLEVAGLVKRFGGLVAVKDISFSVKAGEILGLIGPNGSGKSTVMKSIIGIERPDGGSVRINGVEVAGWPPHRIARLGVGMVFQHSRPLHRQTVLENIILGLLPDRLMQIVPNAAIEKQARWPRRGARPTAFDAALRRSAPDRNRQGSCARSQGSSGG
jgi:branched-chain amino acid transport system ATP-binding protein